MTAGTRPIDNHKDHWEFYEVCSPGWLFRSVKVKGYPIGYQMICRDFIFFAWRDADFVSSYIKRAMQAEIDYYRHAREEHEKFIARLAS